MKKYISKLLMDTISQDELVILKKWLENPKNQSILESYVKNYHDLNMAMLKDNVDEAYEKVIGQIEQRERPVKKLIPNWIRYSAAVVIGIGLMVQYYYYSEKSDTTLVPKEDEITLELDNGTIQTIHTGQSKVVKNAEGNVVGKQEQDQIDYSEANNIKELVYNTLSLPKGKTFRIMLSDGTAVNMNAGSSLRYPVNFRSNESRRVFLTGEAYFDVAKDKERPFIVSSGNLEVEVLGTEFNVSSYSEDAHIEVVLVEGAVNLNTKGELEENPIELSPGQRGSYSRDSKNIHIDTVNTNMYTSWMQGHLVFRELTFDQILTKLERHYNIEILNTNTELGKVVFNASFNEVKIEEVLSFFNDTHEIEYEIKNNTVIIK
ncbi:FecR domain-containing protein [Maribacter polysiphoniae]|uniref:FecR domain-containing protein n=1 Tax=Maribacter polysiphoniae TaxID=429344 RepID=A0A316EHX1_9FLAO|nr:FecR domain-containing protein [Maribacter polysiphoniae]MBD1261676.1 FecR domain-containing protein [Maribacter polysiphoniae]PWK22520.1 FecR family protein [Maribacter polysiphoniae]